MPDPSPDPQHWYRLICADPELTLLYHCYQGCGSASVLYGSATSFLFFNTDPDSTFYFNADTDSIFLLFVRIRPDPDPVPAHHQSDTNLRPLVYRPSRALFEPPRIIVCVIFLYGFPLKLLNVHLNADPDPAFQNKGRIRNRDSFH
jgi:hypothetical protein